MQQLDDIHIAIASSSHSMQRQLHNNLQQRGAIISRSGCLDLNFVLHLECEASADVIMVDISDNYDEDVLELLLEKVDIPILFHEYNDKQFSQYRLEQLAEKISGLRPKSAQAGQDKPTEQPCLEANNKKVRSQLQISVYTETVADIDKNSTVDINVWILGASIGGPESVRRFLTLLPADLPVAFVLAQHLGEGFEKLLAHQLNSASQFRVKQAGNGDHLKHGEVLVTPVDKKIVFDSQGIVTVLEEHWQGHYKPCINEVIDDVTLHFNQHTGIIIFSGMGADGVEASQQFHDQYQGIVWAQEAASCIVSSMPDSVRMADIVSYSGSPEALAYKMLACYRDKKSDPVKTSANT